MAQWDHEYHRLNIDPAQFRLVTISPGTRPDYIVASLTSHFFASHPPYEALSYVWGPYDLEEPCLIELNGVAFETTTNLWRALYHLRSEGQTRTLWIDAICINQQDLEERSSQVQLMRDIYQKSSQTIVWLGEDSFWSGRLFEFLKDVAHTRRWKDEEERIAKIASQQRLQKQVAEDSKVQKIVQRGLYGDIAQREFWTRIWVVQEVALAPKITVYCGSDEMSWETFLGSIWTLEQASNIGMSTAILDVGGLPNLETIDTLREIMKLGGKLLLSDVLACLRRARATDPRDMIYGLLGILPIISIRPDYVSTTIGQLYTRFVDYCITEEGSLDIITLCQGSPNSRLHLPSWVPDWTESWSQQVDDVDVILAANPLILKYGSGDLLINFTNVKDHTVLRNAEGELLKRTAWSAHASTPPRARIENAQNVPRLIVDGILVGELMSVGCTLTRYDTDGEFFFFEAFLNWEERLLEAFGMCIIDSEGRTIQDVFDRCFDIVDTHLRQTSVQFGIEKSEKLQRRKGQRAQRRYDHPRKTILSTGERSSVEALVRTIVADIDGDFQRMTRSRYDQFWDVKGTAWGLEIWALHFTTNRCLLITENGYIGLGPWQARKGDQVCILYGCSVPLVVRPVSGGFSLVGEAYIHSLMDGEAFDSDQGKDFNQVRWTLI